MLQRSRSRPLLRRRDYKTLFIDELGWDNLDGSQVVETSGGNVRVEYVAEKRGVVIVACRHLPLPDYASRGLIERAVSKVHREHLIIFAPEGDTRQIWLWVSREPNRPLRRREFELRDEQQGEAFRQKLEALRIDLEEEDRLTTVDVTSRMRAGFDVDRVTRSFYDRFRKERDSFAKMVAGIPDEGLADWYVAVTLNRLMFVYFIQRRGLLDTDRDYLRNRLRHVQKAGKNLFYRQFLCPLFFEGFARPPEERSPQIGVLLGKVPYLNGGIFARHEVEQLHGETIDIADSAFDRIFRFFDTYQWHLDDRPLRNDNEINPDVLGYIFEKYINQKQMGAYYTKEDITGYIARNTIIPRLFDMAREGCRVAFEGEQAVWRWLCEDPDRYIYPAVRHGVDESLPDEIAAGLHDVSRRSSWNVPAPETHALPTEIWRETIARRQRYEEVWSRLVDGNVRCISDLVTLNLDIQQFAQDVIERSEGPELVRAFWRALNAITVLDPACGSGAFLFAALTVLEPLYWACLQAMEGFMEQAMREGAPRSRYGDFRQVLENVAQHDGKDYFILKSIILNNLYGVDIMPEAVEIARLRLFLKLVAQADGNQPIEPLPDIDFNIRAGNSLVGFTSLDDVQQALRETRVESGQGTAIQARMVGATPDEVAAVRRIETAAEDVDRLYRSFRALQIGSTNEQTSHDLVCCKDALDAKLSSLTTELDIFLSRRYSIGPANPQAYARWHESHRPFHWYAEFFGMMRHPTQSSRGFDVVIGNPPYVAVSKLDYDPSNGSQGGYPDVYAHMLLRAVELVRAIGTLGVIVPLSLAFAEAYSGLRDVVVSAGHSWLSSYDNIPAAIFSGVSQRCTIWLVKRGSERSLFVTPMRRWRSAYRTHLMANTTYTWCSGFQYATFGIPRVADCHQRRALLLMNSSPHSLASSRVGGREARIGYSQTARNFVSSFLSSPPCLDAETKCETVASTITCVSLSWASGRAALAALAGDLFYWYWLARGDGFHVTNWLVVAFLRSLTHMSEEAQCLMDAVGGMLHDYRYEALVFKKNAGKFVGNYNYSIFRSWARRTDMLLATHLGLPLQGVTSIFDHVMRLQSINTNAGEKGIPPAIKERYMAPPQDIVQVQDLLGRIDSHLQSHYGLTEQELFYIVNPDTEYRMGQDNPADDGEGEED